MSACCNPYCKDPSCSGITGGHCPRGCECHPAARDSDPETSWKAAKINQSYRNRLRFNMLLAHGEALRKDKVFYLAHGFTDDEIAIHLDLPVPPNGGNSKMCYWKRHGELGTDFGFLRPLKTQGWGSSVMVPITRKGQRALILTELGLDHLDDVLGRYPSMTKRQY